MNEQERIALTEKVRRSENPYKALFGTDAIGRHGQRRGTGKRTTMPDLLVLPDPRERHKLAMKVHQRTLHIMKQLNPDLYRDIYDAEMKLAAARLMEGNPDQDLFRKFKRRLTPAKGSGGNG